MCLILICLQEMADRSNAQQTIQTYGQVGGNNVTTVQQAGGQQMIVTNAASGSSIPSFGSSFSGNTDYYIQGGQQVKNWFFLAKNIFRVETMYFVHIFLTT